MFEDTLSAAQHGPTPGLLDTHVESFVHDLRARGYAERQLRDRRQVATSFVQWTRARPGAAVDLTEAHVVEFLACTPKRSKGRHAFKRAVLRLFLRHLRHEDVVPNPPAPIDPPEGRLERGYAAYLRDERGLSENSLLVYLPFVRQFLAGRTAASASPEDLDAQAVRVFLLDRVRDHSSEYTRLLATSLRSFLRFLFLRGETQIDLSLSVPTVRRWRAASVHTFLTPEEVERILSATDRTTPTGRRDHAILLLLARLGLRAGEVVALELGDIHWRTGEIVVRGKGRVRDRLPLLSEVGEALACYVQEDRGPSESRRIFLRRLAPRVGLKGPAAIGSVVRLALSRAGLRCSSRRGAAHLFRHSLATRMVRHGASITEISEVLRHRSQGTTEIYAKVAFESLRDVARPWPGTESGR